MIAAPDTQQMFPCFDPRESVKHASNCPSFLEHYIYGPCKTMHWDTLLEPARFVEHVVQSFSTFPLFMGVPITVLWPEAEILPRIFLGAKVFKRVSAEGKAGFAIDFSAGHVMRLACVWRARRAR